jgi:hypothetical protein
MLSIVLITSLIATSAIPPCLIATIKVFSKFGELEERSYHEITEVPCKSRSRTKDGATARISESFTNYNSTTF